MKTTKQRFWSKVDRNGPAHPELGTRCWVWTASTAAGYGNFCVRRPLNVGSHRFSWELSNGPIPEGLWVLHRCDNRRCVNPAHLFLGTAKDNVRDMIAKGRDVPPPYWMRPPAPPPKAKGAPRGKPFPKGVSGNPKGRPPKQQAEATT